MGKGKLSRTGICHLNGKNGAVEEILHPDKQGV